MATENPELQINTDSYWKCPECGQIVEIDYDACGNCRNNKPQKIQKPSFDEILKYQSEQQNRLNAEIFWRCPKCGDLGASKIGRCWNCGNMPT